MAIALVKAGSISTVSGTSITPAFGQSTTAGSLLICCVGAATSLANFSTTASGWTAAAGGAGAEIFMKPNCGAGEAAPTITASTSTTLYAILLEYSGASHQTSPDANGSGGFQPTNTTADTDPSDIVVSCEAWSNSKSATYTSSLTWTPTGGTDAPAVISTAATKASSMFTVAATLLSGQGGGSTKDTAFWTTSSSTGTLTLVNSVIASWKPAPPPTPLYIPPLSVAVPRASNY